MSHGALPSGAGIGVLVQRRDAVTGKRWELTKCADALAALRLLRRECWPEDATGPTAVRLAVGDLVEPFDPADKERWLAELVRASWPVFDRSGAVESWSADANLSTLIAASAIGEPEHMPDCHCESFSDCYKDVTGHRPRDEVAAWSCRQVSKWHDGAYRLEGDTYVPRRPFHGEGDRPECESMEHGRDARPCGEPATWQCDQCGKWFCDAEGSSSGAGKATPGGDSPCERCWSELVAVDQVDYRGPIGYTRGYLKSDTRTKRLV